jgi:hypothetical protein
VAENSRPPVAIRIVRPYASEDEFLEAELETVGKTSVILIGAHPRPTGVILRFEVTLGNGATLLRGEGRVLAHKENAFRGQPGLSLRFTRLDPRSKALVDRAAGLREAKAAGSSGPRSTPPDSRAASVRPQPPVAEAPPRAQTTPPKRPSIEPADRGSSIADALTAATPEPARASRPPAMIDHVAHVPPSSVPPPPAPPDPPVDPVDEAPTHVETRSEHPPPFAPAPSPPQRTSAPGRASSGDPRVIAPPPNRAELLARLRERASKLPPERIDAILRSS